MERRTQDIRSRIIVLFCCVAIGGICESVVAWGQTNENNSISIGTGTEDSLVIVSTTDTVEVKDLLADWNRLHPNIRVEYIHRTSLDVFDSVIECGPSSVCPDIAWSSAMDLQIKLVNDGYGQPYLSPELTAIPSWAVWRNQAFGITAEPIALVYNKTLVPPEDVPRTRADLIKLVTAKRDTYRGKIASYDPERSGSGFLFLTNDLLITADTWRLIRAFGQVGIKLYTYGHTVLDRIASGEHLIAYNMIASYALARAKDDPAIGVVMLRDYTMLMTRIAVIPKTAKHPAAAKLFLDYLLSADGQRQMARRSFGTVRLDLADEARNAAGDVTLRPIHVGPELLTYLDQAKRKTFFREWRRALDER
jgi:iron(III) transport system substrate-binding protein